jgi:NAD(P)-dependent dehydrogenase (short-subunit alcohol dehydrogenase family)
MGERATASAFVTGGGRGLGRAIAEELAGLGARVGLLARTAAEVDSVAAVIVEEGGEARGFAADVLDGPGFERAFGRFLEWSGGCDTLVCAAGRWRAIGPAGTVDPDAWWADVEVNVRGTHRAIQHALPTLEASGRGTIAVLVGPGSNGILPFASAYCVAQAALVRLVEAIAAEKPAGGTRAYAVYPGLVPTALTNHLLDTAEGRRWLPGITEAFAEGKEVDAKVVAEMVGWLATRRPAELSGRLVHAPATPEILETRLTRIVEGDLGVSRVR